jgi:hypothetical protein
MSFDDVDAYCQSGVVSDRLRHRMPILGRLELSPPNEKVQALLAVLTSRARTLLAQLELNSRVGDPPAGDIAESIHAKEDGYGDLADGFKTGSFFGADKIRSRNLYPRIARDAGQRRLNSQSVGDNTQGDESCNKRFETCVSSSLLFSFARTLTNSQCFLPYRFGAAGLVGGISGLWCPHGVCVGLHIMPSAEGRDDIFSAIFTHWETPPKVRSLALSP